ncbi:MAG TPA: DUF1318 domain-containing protein [Polyangia bacterium]|jgi:hypothetical protein
MKHAFIICVALCAALLGAGCIKAPDLVIVDRATALEEQAGGNYRQLERELDRAAVTPRPVPLTHAQIAESGAESEPLAIGDEQVRDGSDESAIDDLLARRCLGEANDGTLVETKTSCGGHVNPASLGRLVERANRDRWQVWRYLQSERPKASLDEVRQAWRAVHLKGVVCGGQVQRADGGWEAKKC